MNKFYLKNTKSKSKIWLTYYWFFSGPQSIMQPGFAGTDHQVRQDISRDLSQGSQQGFSGAQGGFTQQMGGFGGDQSIMMQPGFAGTDAQQVSLVM
ncbi:hypothetical protein [Peribacillus simplex]|uniref:hypothetical protein n=1 Tax=Peribacillus simplex TaxID=1478 RepID=UPI003335B9F7